MSLAEYQKELAWKIVDYQKEIDPYEFRDCYDDENDAFSECLEALSKPSGIKTIIKTFKNDIDYMKSFNSNESFIKKSILNATNLMNEVVNYSVDLKKMEGGMEL